MTRQLAAAVDVIFLDMDGVLLPFGHDANVPPKTNNLFPDETLAALELILTELPTTVLVLSSTWRVRPEFCSEIIESFQLYGTQNNGGGPLATMETFFDITNVHTHSERQWEIQEWLASTPTNVRAWVALDDEELIQGEPNEKYRNEFEGHVIKTRSETGLTESDAREAIALLKQQVHQIQGENR